jgi:hypothetical protein
MEPRLVIEPHIAFGDENALAHAPIDHEAASSRNQREVIRARAPLRRRITPVPRVFDATCSEGGRRRRGSPAGHDSKAARRQGIQREQADADGRLCPDRDERPGRGIVTVLEPGGTVRPVLGARRQRSFVDLDRARTGHHGVRPDGHGGPNLQSSARRRQYPHQIGHGRERLPRSDLDAAHPPRLVTESQPLDFDPGGPGRKIKGRTGFPDLDAVERSGIHRTHAQRYRAANTRPGSLDARRKTARSFRRPGRDQEEVADSGHRQAQQEH